MCYHNSGHRNHAEVVGFALAKRGERGGSDHGMKKGQNNRVQHCARHGVLEDGRQVVGFHEQYVSCHTRLITSKLSPNFLQLRA